MPSGTDISELVKAALGRSIRWRAPAKVAKKFARFHV